MLTAGAKQIARHAVLALSGSRVLSISSSALHASGAHAGSPTREDAKLGLDYFIRQGNKMTGNVDLLSQAQVGVLPTCQRTNMLHPSTASRLAATTGSQ